MARKNPADDEGFYYETGVLNSYGRPQKVRIADPEAAESAGYPVFIFQFGAYGDTLIAVVGQSGLEGAMDVAGQWLEDNAPGVFTEVESEEAERDMTNFSADGSSQWWVPSWEWYVNEYGPKSKEARRARDAVFNAKPSRSKKNPADDGGRGRAKRMMNPQNY